MNSFHLSVPVIGIVRGVSKNFFTKLMLESFSAGLEAIELTLNTNDALDIIGSCRKLVGHGKMLGAGTVCNETEAKTAIDAGAMFLVTPNLNIEVIRYANLKNIPVIAGALTPTEIYNAYHAGASMIKVFPCQSMGGPRYIKELRGPFDSIPLAAVGGVTDENIADYFSAGVTALGVSSALFGKSNIASQKIDGIYDNVSNFIDIVRFHI